MKRRKMFYGMYTVLLVIVLAVLEGCKGCGTAPDTEVPIVEILGIKPDSTHAGTITLQFRATDNVKVAKVECYANGQFIGVAESDPWFMSRNTTQATINWSRSVLRRATPHASVRPKTSRSP